MNKEKKYRQRFTVEYTERLPSLIKSKQITIN